MRVHSTCACNGQNPRYGPIMTPVSPGSLIRAARDDIAMSLEDLAVGVGITTEAVRQYEEDVACPSPQVLALMLTAARLRPSIPLALHARSILALAERYRLTDVRVFGSAAHGRDTERSDIDLLVSLAPGATLFDLGGFAHEVEQLTGFPVDLLVEDDDLAHDPNFGHVLDDAVRL